jgi:hypothetical protein
MGWPRQPKGGMHREYGEEEKAWLSDISGSISSEDNQNKQTAVIGFFAFSG